MRALLIAAAALFSSAAYGQEEPTLTFTAQNTVGAGSVVPVLTWTTTPAATACEASGAPEWSGSKPSSGNQTLTSISSSQTYTMRCTWSGNQRKTVSWTPPTTNVDGSPLTDLAGFEVFFNRSPENIEVPGSGSPYVANGVINRVVIGPLLEGEWFFAVKAFNSAGQRSELSSIVSSTVTPSSVTRTVGIVVDPVPNTATNVTVTDVE
jgi:hypothetical protein